MRAEHDFTVTRDEWEDAVVNNAVEFRVHRFLGSNRDGQEFSTMLEAVTIARAQPKPYRVLLYAATAAGRAVCVPQEDWDRLLRSRKEIA